MRVLLDTNIVIHRENPKVSNYSIGHLFRWLDRLKYDKVIHPRTIEEIKKYNDSEVQKNFSVKLEAYEVLKVTKNPDDVFLDKIGEPEKSENDHVDNCLLFEVYLGHVDMLVTEDRKLLKKAIRIGLAGHVLSINSFIGKASSENPALIEYKTLAVKKVYFGDVDVNDIFFDSFRKDYNGFDNWFSRKCNEEAYICRSEKEVILGFLYLKTEGISENYYDIKPIFEPKKRLKVGTFKVESTGFRLGERFIKIIFDNAIKRNVDEIYVTLYADRAELLALTDLLRRWGFYFYGFKDNGGKKEKVFVKPLHIMRAGETPKINFPNFSMNCRKFILPIYSKYHTRLLPDSKLNNENEEDFLGYEPHLYALQKVYISWAPTNGAKPGDLILFYRMAEEVGNKKYRSVVSTIALIDEIVENISSENELLSLCQNRSVFTEDELKSFWAGHRSKLKVLKFIFVKSLKKRLPLRDLWEDGIVQAPGGPRPFTEITDAQFNMLVRDSGTEIEYVK